MTDDVRRLAPRARSFRLLPSDNVFGWTPFAWLIYLPTFIGEPIAYHRPAWQIAVSWAISLVFLATYFRGYWLRGRDILPIIVVQVLLGVVATPINSGAAVLFVYAAAFACRLDTTRAALRAIGAISLAGAASAWAFHMPPFFWAMATVLPWLIGGVNVHFVQVGRANRALKLAQDEIAHLAAVAERDRIARDLHDLLGHTLSLITLKAELASKLVDRDPSRATREMREVEHVSRSALQDVRETIRGMRATLDDEIGRARTLLAAAGIATEVDAAPAALPRRVDETLALAVREAATNVVRHAGARTCRIRVRAYDDTARLDVTDDGAGRAAPDGTGLLGMRERVEALGGTVTRRHHRGTTLTVVLPVREHSGAGTPDLVVGADDVLVAPRSASSAHAAAMPAQSEARRATRDRP